MESEFEDMVKHFDVSLLQLQFRRDLTSISPRARNQSIIGPLARSPFSESVGCLKVMRTTGMPTLFLLA